jgi:hypothetical protein
LAEGSLGQQSRVSTRAIGWLQLPSLGRAKGRETWTAPPVREAHLLLKRCHAAWRAQLGQLRHLASLAGCKLLHSSVAPPRIFRTCLRVSFPSGTRVGSPRVVALSHRRSPLHTKPRVTSAPVRASSPRLKASPPVPAPRDSYAVLASEVRGGDVIGDEYGAYRVRARHCSGPRWRCDIHQPRARRAGGEPSLTG